MAKKRKTKKTTEQESAQKEAESGQRASGEPEANLGAIGVGGVGGAVAGAALGTAVGGPVGGAIGAAVGAIAGGTAADQLQDEVDPKVEELYWRDNYHKQSYFKSGDTFETYLPAYRFGWEAADREGATGREFDEIESQLKERWENQDGTWSEWTAVREVVRSGFNRIRERRLVKAEY